MKSLRKRMRQAPYYDTWLPSLMLLLLAILLSLFPLGVDISSWIHESSQTEQLERGSERSFPIFLKSILERDRRPFMWRGE